MNTALIRIQLPPVIESSYGAYVKLQGATEDLKKVGLEWASRICQDPIRTTLAQFIESEFVTVRAFPRKDVPDPPMDMLRGMRMGPEEERRFKEATHVVVVNAQFPFRHPPLNVFGALETANGLAARFDGVVFDPPPGMTRLLPVRSLEEPIPSDGRVIIVKQIVCPMSTADGGAGWMTTVGMRRFGLPNFEMRNIPPNLQEVLPVMNSVAHRVLQEALAQAWQVGEKPLAEVVVPAEITITQQDMVAAFGKGNASAGQTTVRLSFDGKRRGELEPFITVGPPTSYQGELGEWYYAMLSEFLGGPRHEGPVTRGAGDDALERAHARALGEWPGVRDRFVRGLSPQQKLFVKRGFPVRDGGSEFMWVAVVGLQDGQVLGMLANDSSQEKDLRAGKKVSFAEGDIFDWMLMEGKRREGGYSIEALGG